MDENLKKGRDQAMEEQENKLGTAPIGKLLVQMSLPAITAQVINALYNIVDRIYIGHLPEVGSLALASLGVAFPLIMIISAFAALIGMGGSPRAAIAMGAGKKDEAEKILGNSFSALFLMSIVLTVLFLLTSDTLLTWFGATEKSLPMAKSYFTIYVLGTISVQMALGLNSFISAQGFSTMSMMTVLIGAISNIILDPILIYGFDMGGKGSRNCDRLFPDHFGSLGYCVPYRQENHPENQDGKLEDSERNSASSDCTGCFPIYHAVDRKSGTADIQRADQTLWWRSGRYSYQRYEHSAFLYAVFRTASNRTDSGCTADCQL